MEKREMTIFRIYNLRYVFILMLFAIYHLSFVMVPAAFAETKNFSGAGDGTTWSDEDNWSPEGEPTSDDDVQISREAQEVEATSTFSAKTIMVGDGTTSTLKVNNFVFGTVSPDNEEDVAIENSSGGKISLNGSAGTVTLTGQLKFSKVSTPTEQSVLFWVD